MKCLLLSFLSSHQNTVSLSAMSAYLFHCLASWMASDAIILLVINHIQSCTDRCGSNFISIRCSFWISERWLDASARLGTEYWIHCAAGTRSKWMWQVQTFKTFVPFCSLLCCFVLIFVEVFMMRLQMNIKWKYLSSCSDLTMNGWMGIDVYLWFRLDWLDGYCELQQQTRGWCDAMKMYVYLIVII